ncbi:MAG: endopeptidase La [Anaeroplasmataceae bacterium]
MEKLEFKGLPVIPLRAVVPIPNNEFRIELGREISIKAIEYSELFHNGEVILVIQKNNDINDLSDENMREIAVKAQLTLKLKLPNNNYKVKFDCIETVKVSKIDRNDSFISCEYESYPTIYDEKEVLEVALRKVVTEIATIQRSGLNNSDEVMKLIKQGLTPEVTCNKIAANLKNFTSHYQYIETQSLLEKAEILLTDINKEKLYNDIDIKIDKDVKKSIDESQKEYYLREKMKAIQNELGDKVRQEEEVDELRKKILAKKMPAHIEEKALNELQRFASTPTQVAESGIIRNYLDFMVELPWSEKSEDESDLVKVSEVLNKNHYALEKVKDRILEYLAVKIMTKKNPQTILCLVGPPGVGKTSLAKSIADALGRKFVKQSLGGISDESEIRGHRRTYIGALPGRITKGMKTAGTINPVYLLDEIDKLTSNHRGDPSSALLEVLDPEQNSKFSDNYLEEEYDLSQVMFITTANDLSTIQGPLRDRMEIIELSSYTEHEKFNIAYKHLIDRQLEAHGLTNNQFSIKEDAMYFIIRNYTREAGVRELSRMIGTLIRKSTKDILINKTKEVIVDINKVIEYLGKVKYFNNVNRNNNEVGIVTGLAYTTFGGDTLDIEVTFYKGKGNLVLTGKLGDVMKESAQAALSFVKTNAAKFNIDSKIFDENDIHIHVPEGAVPKDGPSAGVTMTTAIVSSLTNRKVDSLLGMTGEVTLRGQVLPIGGLKEKAIAAHRSGLKTIIIPFENERDVADIPNEVASQLEIIPVKNVLEVIQRALI